MTADRIKEGEPLWKTDPRAFIASLTSDQILDAMEVCVKDLADAAETQPNSEWHESCFAAAALYCEEMGKRGLKRAA